MVQRRIISHIAADVKSPLKAYLDYHGGHPQLPTGLEAEPRVTVPRPERVEAEISAADIRQAEREGTDFTTR
jgi:hypothetical protein